MRAILALCLGATAAEAQFAGGERPSTDLRLDVGGSYGLDDQTDRRLAYGELRSSFDGVAGLGSLRGELHLDGRGRYSMTEVLDHRVDVSRAYLGLGAADGGWAIALGRLSIEELASARVDGARATLALGEELGLLVFGGLMPHPLDGTPNVDFVSAGLGYRARGVGLEHEGGVAMVLYRGALDRLYLSERVYWRLAEAWQLHGFALVDLVGVSGVLGELGGVSPDAQSAGERVDVSSADLTLRFAPSRSFDASLSGSHHHTVLPKEWWADHLAEERARRGFVLDGPTAVGTRRSGARLVANVHLSPELTPYAQGRFDHRAEDGAIGFEGALGLKLEEPALGYADLRGAARSLFGTSSQLVSLSAGRSFAEWLGADLSASALRVVGASAAELSLDLELSVWVDLRALADLRLFATYQAFVASDLIYQAGFVRLGYRFRSE